MTSVTLRMVPVSLLALTMLAGCSMFDRDEYGMRGGGWYGDDDDDDDAVRPIGSRQKHHHGLLWPPYPRPADVEGAEFCHRFHHAHYWPLPYVCDDRAYVRHVSEMQVINGWTAETTLYDYHFVEGTAELNQSGRLHLHWILQDVPVARRMVWVQTAMDPQTSQARLANVQIAGLEMAGEGNVPPIMLRPGSIVGGKPAQEVDLQTRAYLGSIPMPRLPNRGATSE